MPERQQKHNRPKRPHHHPHRDHHEALYGDSAGRPERHRGLREADFAKAALPGDKHRERSTSG